MNASANLTESDRNRQDRPGRDGMLSLAAIRLIPPRLNRQAVGLPHHDHPGGVVKPGVWDDRPATL